GDYTVELYSKALEPPTAKDEVHLNHLRHTLVGLSTAWNKLHPDDRIDADFKVRGASAAAAPAPAAPAGKLALGSRGAQRQRRQKDANSTEECQAWCRSGKRAKQHVCSYARCSACPMCASRGGSQAAGKAHRPSPASANVPVDTDAPFREAPRRHKPAKASRRPAKSKPQEDMVGAEDGSARDGEEEEEYEEEEEEEEEAPRRHKPAKASRRPAKSKPQEDMVGAEDAGDTP
ncbi:unnamed protein product, partial [Prorocentrum cordatum]